MSNSKNTLVTSKELQDAKVPLEYRDFCAHLIIPLDSCRRDSFYAPWKCTKERTAWQKCQYDQYHKRMRSISSEH